MILNSTNFCVFNEIHIFCKNTWSLRRRRRGWRWRWWGGWQWGSSRLARSAWSHSALKREKLIKNIGLVLAQFSKQTFFLLALTFCNFQRYCGEIFRFTMRSSFVGYRFFPGWHRQDRHRTQISFSLWNREWL